MSGDVTPYTGLVTSEHADKPNFVATVALLTQGLADLQDALAGLPGKYDLDAAVGVQLDAVGEWVGRTRFLSEPLTGVYFTFDDATLGFDQGTWLGPFDPTTGLVALGDEAYRTLLRATIVANQWDGTVSSAYTAWDVLFAGQDLTLVIQDNGDMTMLFALIGALPDAVTLALLTTGQLLGLKPGGVRIAGYVVPTVTDAPYFGFDAQTAAVSGFDTGAFGQFI